MSFFHSTLVAPNWQDALTLALVVGAVGYLIRRQIGKKARDGKSCSSGDCKCTAKKLVEQSDLPREKR